MKNVEFNGKNFDVPEWAKYITMDGYGEVMVWNNPPKREGMYYKPVYEPTSQCEHVGSIRQFDRYKEIS